jgi:hypothetical protein
MCIFSDIELKKIAKNSEKLFDESIYTNVVKTSSSEEREQCINKKVNLKKQTITKPKIVQEVLKQARKG